MKKALIVSLLLTVAFVVFTVLKTPIGKSKIILTTDPPPDYMIKDLEEQMGCAKRAGFIIKKPTLRTMKPPFNSKTPNGLAYMDLDIIVLIPFASYETLAHELGHIIDAQTKRKGHPFFADKQNLDIQSFADAVKEVILKECALIKS